MAKEHDITEQLERCRTLWRHVLMFNLLQDSYKNNFGYYNRGCPDFVLVCRLAGCEPEEIEKAVEDRRRTRNSIPLYITREIGSYPILDDDEED